MAKHLTLEERGVVYRMRKRGETNAEIARTLGRHRSTIGREVRRNTGGRGYRQQQAQCLAEARRERCRRTKKLAHAALRKYVTKALKHEWSPDEIAGRSKRDHPRDRACQVSHQTIYNWLRDEAPQLRTHLRRGHRRRQPETRGKLTDCVSVKDRPKIVDSKRRYGDWEGDTVVSPGRRSGLVTMVDRKSKYLLVRKTCSLKSADTMQAMCRGMRDLPESLRHTMTLDNGKEFALHKRLTDKLGLNVYFAQPYASWQRGLNENTNGLLRQYFPKGTDFSRISHRAVARVQKLLNDRPRKSLGYKTPAEVLANKLCCN